MDEMQNNQGDVTQSQETAIPESQPSPEINQAASAETQSGATEKPAPFHEHPRFKELIDQNREYKTKMSDYEKSLNEMRMQMIQAQNAFMSSQNKQEVKADPTEGVLSKLKGIDPEFAQFQEQLYREASTVGELKQQLAEFAEWKQNLELQQLKTKAESTLESLYSEHKVDPELRDIYRAQITKLANETPNANLEHLGQFFKATHENMSKMLDNIRRRERESYVKDKSKDVVPMGATGGVAPGGKVVGGSQAERIAMVANALKSAKQKI